MTDCVWDSDIKLSTRGIYAVIAGFWWPPTTCRRCGAKREQVNERFAKENEWLDSNSRG